MATAGMYGIAEWYIHKHNSEPLQIGTTFIPDYAEYLGLDPKATLSSILNDLEVKNIRLVGYWSTIEQTPGKYDFSSLDWQFKMAQDAGAKVSLAIGLRQPRWPECHLPTWAETEPKSVWQPQLYSFMSAVIARYKDNPSLDSYQLENEFFMKIFGTCTDFDRSRLTEEYNLVKKLDPDHTVIIARSDNWVGVPVRQPTPDRFGISVYKRVWDYHFTKRYVEYPFPPWYYAFLGGLEEMISGKDMVIHEMQAEPWLPPGMTINKDTLAEQAKTMDAKRLKDRIKYAQDTGVRSIDLWGAEWWYWMKATQNDPSEWNVVKQAIVDANTQNQKLTVHK